MTHKVKLISAGLGIAAMLGAMGASSFAEFTASGHIDGQTSLPGDPHHPPLFQAGTLAITPSFSPGEGNNWHEVTESHNGGGVGMYDSMTNLAPGDIWTRTLTVRNTGTLPEIYQITVGTTGLLFQHTQFTNNDTLSNYYPAVVSISGNTGGGSTPLVSNINDQSPSTPSQWILIDPNKQETLVVTVQLPYNANNAYQGTTGDFTVSFNAQQSDSNALADSANTSLTETP